MLSILKKNDDQEEGSRRIQKKDSKENIDREEEGSRIREGLGESWPEKGDSDHAFQQLP